MLIKDRFVKEQLAGEAVITPILKSSPDGRGRGTRARSDHEEEAQLTRRGPPGRVLGKQWDKSIKALDVQFAVTQASPVANLFVLSQL